MHNKRAVVNTAMFLVLILVVFLLFSLFSGHIKQETPHTEPGYADLTGFDFSNKLAYLLHTSFLYYKNAYYTPEDFKTGNVAQQGIDLTGVDVRFNPGSYGTYRMVLKLPMKESYGISAYSAMYSQRLYINGKEYPSTGIPGTTTDTTIPKSNHYTIYFTPEQEQTEIIIQFANFCHADYGGVLPLYLGSQQMITARDAVVQQRIHIFLGCTVTSFLFFLGLFLFFSKRRAFLWFSIACFTIGVRILVVDEKVIMLLIPNLPWELSIGLEYLSLIVLVLTFLFYINSMFTGALHKTTLWAFGVVCTLYALAVLVLPAVIYTGFMLWFQLIAALFGIYVAAALIYNVARKKENRHTEHLLIFTGVLIFITLSILDIQLHRSGMNFLMLGLSETGMIIFIFVNMLALVLQFSRTEAELDTARRNELQMQETNRLLDRMSRMKSDFLADISHEMRTPLTVIASYAGLTTLQIRKNAVDKNTLDNLETIKREAIRLAGLVEQLKDVAMEKDRQLVLTGADAVSLLREAAEFCSPICLKNNNRITVNANSSCIPLRVNTDSIFQTLINLIINANRHTKDDIIQLTAQIQPLYAVITVADNGDGIDPKLLPKLFERGVSGDGGTGLGLAICKEVIEEHGGEIIVDSTRDKGTAFIIKLPYKNE
ncbi:sensor histidine kinase [Acetanaerobacterium elongatum]|uniref:sensor histidine kinase n=1 Tax=Acetanaerobacterium elongatum TaxID=258515 RepID=UPI000B8953AB|nr:sensor histidine kinase [Acetanaerobacterium elongatum]